MATGGAGAAAGGKGGAGMTLELFQARLTQVTCRACAPGWATRGWGHHKQRGRDAVRCLMQLLLRTTPCRR